MGEGTGGMDWLPSTSGRGVGGVGDVRLSVNSPLSAVRLASSSSYAEEKVNIESKFRVTYSI